MSVLSSVNNPPLTHTPNLQNGLPLLSGDSENHVFTSSNTQLLTIQTLCLAFQGALFSAICLVYPLLPEPRPPGNANGCGLEDSTELC